MYEKPQYLTDKGYRRMDKNPHKENPAAKPKLVQVKPPVTALTKKQLSGAGKGISPEAARLIAGALSMMLKQK
jgi:hypothetical protein